MNALRLLRSNNDTMQIATRLGITEAEAYNRLAQEREDERERRKRAYYYRRNRDALREIRGEAGR